VLTGHYAKIGCEPAGFVLPAATTRQDQSYFLYPLTHRELAKLTFPRRAQKTKCAKSPPARLLHGQADSQDACFQSKANASAKPPGCVDTRRSRAGSSSRQAGRATPGFTLHHRAAQGPQRRARGSGVCEVDRPVERVIELETDPAALLARSFRVSACLVQPALRRRAMNGSADPLPAAARSPSDRTVGEGLRVVPAEPQRAVTSGRRRSTTAVRSCSAGSGSAPVY
jgi:hypothetical protein